MSSCCPAVPEPRVGRLDLSLQFANGGSEEYGVIGISVCPDWDALPEDHASIPSELSRYAPLEAHWDP
jgi:hypothetical protein